MKTNCDKCDFFESIEGKDFGYCHKNPPLAQASNSNYATFPKVKVDSFCFDGTIKVQEFVGFSQPVEEPQLLVEEIQELEEKPKKFKSKKIEG